MLEELPSHRQLRKLVADQIRAAILDGRFKPGEWLRQEKVAQELAMDKYPGVSCFNPGANSSGKE